MVKTFSKTYKVPLYDCTLCVKIISSEQEYIKFRDKHMLEEHHEDNDWESFSALSLEGRNNNFFVILKEESDDKDIVHESVHCANHILSTIGATMDFDNDEPQAYLVEWAYTKITNTLALFRGNKKKDESI